MNQYFKLAVLLFTCIYLSNCTSQNSIEPKNKLSEDFDKSMPFYFGMPKKLNSSDTSPVFSRKGQKVLLTGTVYQVDGKTPEADAILYYYQTNTKGKYPVDKTEKRNMPRNALGQTHGFIRGWVKTDKQGKYSIYTIMPGSYPSRNEVAHIHITVKEKKITEPYYLDNFVFDSDRLLTTERRKKMENRGGSGIVRFVEKDSIWIGERDIILGLNIPDYPIENNVSIKSGRAIGEDIISFNPYHAYGKDKGTKTCPVCKYGWYHGIIYFVGNNPNWNEIKDWLRFLDKASQARAEYLKVYFVYGNEKNFNKQVRVEKLNNLGKKLGLKEVALTFVPSFKDKDSEINFNEINPNTENTFLVYKRSIIIDKYINLKPNKINFKKLLDKLDKSDNEYFKLSRPK